MEIAETGKSFSPMGKEKPICVAIVICNEIIEDKTTNNKTLVSLFSAIQVSSLPTQHPRMFIMASFTSGHGKFPISFRITSPSGQELMRIDGEADFVDPLATYDFVVEVRSLVLHEEGVHTVDVLVGGEPLAGRRFNVVVQR
ncbi:MAG: hypothetical protein NZT92_12795 [Abditibacteriales bacterium]|nr:hypothetical protein [Abditibacteriales bacterium]MDW8366565.1 hypothetical protein [Abditibacteriales bacterium]